jgi:uncharacterized iron-regulated protein
MTRRDALAACAAGLLTTTAAASKTAAAARDSRWRIHDTTIRKDVTWQEMADTLSPADVVFAGEFHDDPQTHLAELALLDTLSNMWRQSLTLAMEMLERDSQTDIDAYLAGKTEEAAFRKFARLWPDYARDYRPLVEFARAGKIPVLGSNAPAPIVKRVGKEGFSSVLASLTDAEKRLVAETVNAPTGDAYDKRFTAAMGGAHGEGKMDAGTIRRYYEAQCVRDDTMAETVVRALEAGRKVLHINGAFHSDAGLGTAQRVLWRRPLRTRIAICKFVPVKSDVSKAAVKPYLNEADFVIFVPDERAA